MAKNDDAIGTVVSLLALGALGIFLYSNRQGLASALTKQVGGSTAGAGVRSQPASNGANTLGAGLVATSAGISSIASIFTNPMTGSMDTPTWNGFDPMQAQVDQLLYGSTG